MAVIKLKIDKVEYDIQCKNGEEPILREIETQINKIISDNPDIRSLPQSKMLLMISLFASAIPLRFSKFSICASPILVIIPTCGLINFESALIQFGYDDELDNYVETDKISQVQSLKLNDRQMLVYP
mgnify:CR=1 FL=1